MKNIFDFVRNVTVAVSVLSILFLASCGKMSSDRVPAGKGQGALVVQTVPDGAKLHIMGRSTTHQSGEEIQLPFGTYTVAVEKDGYLPSWVQVQLNSGKKTNTVTVNLDPVTVSMLVTSEPEGAAVTLDGEEINVTPCVISGMRYGTYDMTLSLNNYKTVSRKITVPRQSNMPDSPFSEHFPLKGDTGGLKITSVPEGASIEIDGKKYPDQTPASISLIKEGNHKVCVSKEHFEPLEVTVSVERDKVTEVPEFNLKQLPGSLTLVSVPDNAKIELDGKDFGVSGTKKDIKAGKYSVKVSCKGYDDEVREVEVGPEQNVMERFELQSNTGVVTFVTNPPGVSIIFDGHIIGMTQPSKADPEKSEKFEIIGVPAGKHTIEFTHPLSPDSESETFELTTDKKHVTLKRKDLWIPNADIIFTRTGERFKDCRIVKEGDMVIFEKKEFNNVSQKVSKVQDSKKKSEMKIIYHEKVEFSDPKYKTSQVNLLNFDNKSATLRVEKLPAGCEIRLNDVSYGVSKSPKAPFIVSNLNPGEFTVKIVHPNGKNVSDPSRNFVQFKDKIKIEVGEVKSVTAPPLNLFWIPDAKITMKDGTVYSCHIVRRTPDSTKIDLGPQTKEKELKNADILRIE